MGNKQTGQTKPPANSPADATPPVPARRPELAESRSLSDPLYPLLNNARPSVMGSRCPGFDVPLGYYEVKAVENKLTDAEVRMDAPALIKLWTERACANRK